MPSNWPGAATAALNQHFAMYGGLPWTAYADMLKIYGPRLSISHNWVSPPDADVVIYIKYLHTLLFTILFLPLQVHPSCYLP